MYGISQIRAFNSSTPNKVLFVYHADYRQVVQILTSHYLSEGELTMKESIIFALMDAFRNGFRPST